MRIFLDTEFTCLSKQAELISAGLVTETGQKFYFERTDYDRSLCSDFVKQTVLPLLDAPVDFRWPARECAARLAQWLDDLGDDHLYLIADSHYDADVLHEITAIDGGLKSLLLDKRLEFQLLFFNCDVQRRGYLSAYLNYFKQNPGKEHHALHDAMAMRQGWMTMNGYYV